MNLESGRRAILTANTGYENHSNDRCVGLKQDREFLEKNYLDDFSGPRADSTGSRRYKSRRDRACILRVRLATHELLPKHGV